MSAPKPSTAVNLIPIPSAKVKVSFKANQLPKIDPGNPVFALDLGGIRIEGSVAAKAARKLQAHSSPAALEGRLVAEKGKLRLLDAGIQCFDPAPPKPSEPDTAGGAS